MVKLRKVPKKKPKGESKSLESSSASSSVSTRLVPHGHEQSRAPRGSLANRQLWEPPILAMPNEKYIMVGQRTNNSSSRASGSSAVAGPSRAQGEREDEGVEGDVEMDHADEPLLEGMVVYQIPPPRNISKNRQKKEAQWRVWEYDMIPRLVEPYLRLMRETKSLRDDPIVPEHPSCTCHVVRNLDVMCVYSESEYFRVLVQSISKGIFTVLECVELRVCECWPAALQLLQRGLFPCSPRYPTLAVYLRQLEFVRELFVRLPPNVTAWCGALEVQLWRRGYKLESRVSLLRCIFYLYLRLMVV